MANTVYIRKKRKKIKRIFVPIAIFLALVIAFFAHIVFNVYPILEAVTTEEVKNTTTVVLNESLKSVMGKQIVYDDIVNINHDENGNIKALSVNTILVNDIARNVTLVALSKLKNLGEIAVKVPIGTLSGITFLGGLGPEVTVRCIPAGSVNVTFKSDFKSVGINNTLHSIMMLTDSSVSVVIPGLSQTVNLQTQIPMVNTIIVGNVPDTYLQSNALDEMLNLIP